MYQIIIIPGFQQSGFSPEYRVENYTSERSICDHRSRKSATVVTVCNNAAAVDEVYQMLNNIEWQEVIALEKYNAVDDVEQVLFIGDFGRVTIPVRYFIERQGLSNSERELCLNLYRILKTVESLDYK